MFAIPWHGHTLRRARPTRRSRRRRSSRGRCDEEIDFILETAGRYLHKAPTRDDVLSVFVGIRPLVQSGDGKLTAALSRDHTIHIDASGLLTTTGGKWTTYRNMAEHTVDQAADLGAAGRAALRHAHAERPRLPPQRRTGSARSASTAPMRRRFRT